MWAKVGDRVMVYGGGHGSCCTVPLREIVKLPDNVSLENAAFVIIAGFSLAAVRKARVALGHTVLVAGLGLLGLYAVQYLKLAGALHIIASDFDPSRRALAKENKDKKAIPSLFDRISLFRMSWLRLCYGIDW